MHVCPASPPPACAAAVHAFVLTRKNASTATATTAAASEPPRVRNGRGFRVDTAMGLKHLTLLLPRLLECPRQDDGRAGQPRLVDVGAGIHNMPGFELKAKRLHADDSDALWILAGFGERAEVHGFEANPKKAAQLQAAARSRPNTAAYARQLTVHSEALGSVVRETRVAKCGTASTWATTHQKWMKRCGEGARINETRLDVAFSPPHDALLYLKVDIEGGEWAVLEGMTRLLREQRIELMSFECAAALPLDSPHGGGHARAHTLRTHRARTHRQTDAHTRTHSLARRARAALPHADPASLVLRDKLLLQLHVSC